MASSCWDVMHIWANQSKERKKAGNVFFEGDTIYSYGTHFPMARHVRNREGERAILFTRKTYSVTTASHMSSTRSAVHGLNRPVFLVPYVDRHIDYSKKENKDYLKSAFGAYVNDATSYAIKAKKARKCGDSYVSQMRDALQEAKALSDFFKLGCRVPSEDSLAPPELLAKIADAKKRERELAKQRLAEQQLRERAAFEAWRKGEGFSCPSSYATDKDGSVYLRVVGEEVQTSRMATAPLDQAIRAFRFVKLCRMTGRAFQVNGTRVDVGNFSIREITAEGNVTIGCHFITWERIKECAEANGFFDQAASAEAVRTKGAADAAF